MRTKGSAVALVISFFGMCGVQAQELDFNITGAGARAAGFGGAFIGVADDATAVVWNPSGLATLERPEASLVTRFVSDSYEIEFIGRDFTFDETQSHFVMNFLSGAYPFEFGGRKMVGAVAYQRQLDFYSEYEDEFIKRGSSGGADTFTPGVAVHLTPLISVGVSANIWFGTTEFDYEDKNDPEFSFTLEESFSGSNFVLGALGDLSALDSPLPLKVGISIRTPFELEGEYTSEGETVTETVEMPSMTGLGVSYRVNENLTLAADYETRAYGDSKVKSDGDESSLTSHEEDLKQYRVGAEYLLISDMGVFPIRVGFKNVPTIFATNCPDCEVAVGTGFSVGSGLITEKYAIDATYSTSGYEQEWEQVFKASTRANIITLSGIFYF